MLKIKITSKKYNGTLRDSYDAYLLEETDELVTLFVEPNTPSWNHRKNELEYGLDGIIEIYFKNRWFNVLHICEQHSGINLTYINLATPIRSVNDGFEWVDLDLDYRVHLDGSFELLDEDEYIQNREEMNYPDNVTEHVRTACQEIEDGLMKQAFPFNHNDQVERYVQVKKKFFAKVRYSQDIVL